MSAVVVYKTRKTGNTKTVVDELARRNPHLSIMPVEQALAQPDSLRSYDAVVLASGIYFGYPDKKVRKVAQALSKDMPVFTLLTHGSNSDHYKEKWLTALNEMGLNTLGAATCQGFYNFGPFHLVGGMHPETPTPDEVNRVVSEAEAALAEIGA